MTCFIAQSTRYLLIKEAPAFFFKTAFLYLPFVHMIVSVAVLQCWDLTRSLGGVSCSSHWAALCWPPLWSGLSSALASRRRLNVSLIHVRFDYLMTPFLNSHHWVSADHWQLWFPHLSLWTSEGFSVAHVASTYSRCLFMLIQQMEFRDF